MIQATHLRKTSGTAFRLFVLFSFLFLLAFTQLSFAEGVFENRKKAHHSLTGSELNRLKADHQLRFGKSKSSSSGIKSSNPWERKKQKAQQPVQRASWGECRDFALTKRNYCYREGRNAYGCEQKYEARARLCDQSL